MSLLQAASAGLSAGFTKKLRDIDTVEDLKDAGIIE
jgi:hypothetical protein